MIFSNRNSGLTLIELLVAIALGALLLAGATTLFVNNRATYQLTHDLARMQENARFAMETMIKDLRLAGYSGCFNGAGTSDVNILIPGPPDGELWDFSFPIEGYESDQAADPADRSWQPSGHVGQVGQADEPHSVLAVTTFGTADAPTDGITVRFLDGHRNDADADDIPDLQVTNAVYSGSRNISVNNLDLATANIVKGQPAALSDCGSSDVFLVDNTPATAGSILANDLSRTFDPVNKALFARLSGARYFVRANADDIPSLFRAAITIDTATDTPVERTDALVDGVDSLQVLYGLDSDGNNIIESFVPAGDVTDWAAVSAIRFALLMRTVNEYGTQPIEETRYQVLDKTFCTSDDVDADCEYTLPAGDRHSRRVYETTVRVRNL